jgi:hypothetical protein
MAQFDQYMREEDFAAIMEKHGITPKVMAEHLGIREATVDYYAFGIRPIPQEIATAANWIANEYKHNPWARGEIQDQAKVIRHRVLRLRPKRRRSTLKKRTTND